MDRSSQPDHSWTSFYFIFIFNSLNRIFKCDSFQHFFVPCWKFWSNSLGKAQQLQEQRYPFLSVCAVFSCVRTMVWLPVFGIFNVAQTLMLVIAHGSRAERTLWVSICTGSWLWEKNLLPHRGLEPASVLRLAFQSDAVPTELGYRRVPWWLVFDLMSQRPPWLIGCYTDQTNLAEGRRETLTLSPRGWKSSVGTHRRSEGR